MALSRQMFGRDLHRVRSGELSFQDLNRRYRGFIIHTVKPWLSSCPVQFALDDLAQEAWIEIATAIETYEEARGVPIELYARSRVQFRIKGMIIRSLKRQSQEQLFLEFQIVEDRVVEKVSNGSATQSYALASEFEQVVQIRRKEARARAMRVIGELSSAKARAVIAVVLGKPRQEIIDAVFVGKSKLPRKQYFRTIAGATQRMEVLTAQQELDFRYGPSHHKSKASVILRPVRKAPHARQSPERAGARQ